jgi:hypothetical protein
VADQPGIDRQGHVTRLLATIHSSVPGPVKVSSFPAFRYFGSAGKENSTKIKPHVNPHGAFYLLSFPPVYL